MGAVQGADGHQGSWKIPGTNRYFLDQGVTEYISNIFGQGRTAEGGSPLRGPSSSTDLVPIYDEQGQTTRSFKDPYNKPQVLGTSARDVVRETNPQPTGGGNQGGGINWGAGLTGEQVRSMGLNPDSMISRNGLYYNSNQGDGGGGQQQDESQMISDMYAPALSALDQVMQGLQSSQTESTGMISDMYGSGMSNIGNEQQDLQSGLQLQENKLNQGAMNANDQARRDYNALIQQGKSTYGMGSSAGGAISELIRQEYMRTGGQMRQQVQEGIQQLGMEATKLKTYISGKKTDLDNWKMQAMKDINDTFKNGMNDIALRRGDIEANKTRDKMALLQSAKDRVQAIADRDYQFKQNLGQFAVETLQQATGKAFTPQEIAGVVNEMMSQTLGDSQKNTAPGGQVAYRIPGVKTQDELDKLATPYQA